MTASEELKEKAATLPEPLAKEVLDFLLFVASRHRSMPVTPGSESMRGSLGHRASPEKLKQETGAWKEANLKKHASD
jgi:hypothetical protein